MEMHAEFTVRLAWHGERVTSVVLENGLPAHEAALARPIGPVLVIPWEESVPLDKAKLLAKALFPPPVRRILAERTSDLGPGRYLRLRLRLPDVEEAGPFDLGALRWESVRVPSALASRAAWTAWAVSLELPPDGGTPLGRHPWFTLVRDVVPRRPPSPSVAAAPGLVAVADATAVHGAITVRDGRTTTVPEPAPGALRDADRRQVESAVRDSRLTVRAVDSPATAEAIRRTLDGGAQVFYFGGHHIAGGLVVGDAPGGRGAAWLDVDVLAGWLRDGGVGLAVLMACDSAGPSVGSSAGPSVGSMHGAPDNTPGSSPDRVSEKPGGSAAERLVRAGVPHVVAVQGWVSHGQAAEFAGRFFHSLVGGFDIDLALREGTDALEGAGAVPVLYARHDSVRPAVGLLPTVGTARLPPVAHRVPVDDDTAPPDERHRIQLDVRWCLAERPVRDVLADPGADDLPSVLTGAEWILLRARAAKGLPHEERRHWYVCDVRGGRLPETEADLRGAVSPAYTALPAEDHRGVGLVLRCPADEVLGAGFPGALDWLHGFGWDIRVVVLQVYGEHPADVRKAAGHLARKLGEAEYLVRHEEGEGGAATVPAGRTGQGRAASLLLAADRDDDLDRWLRAAGGAVPVPSEFGPLDRSTAFADSVVLGMVRTACRGGAAFEEWLDETSGAVRTAVVVLERPDPPLGGPDLELPEVAVALDRAGALVTVDLADLDPTGRWPGSWALLARRRLTTGIAEWLYGLDEGQRRALGVARASDRFDLALEDQLTAIREALAPPLRLPWADD